MGSQSVSFKLASRSYPALATATYLLPCYLITMSAPKRARKNPPKASKAAASANDVPLEPAAPSVKISTLTLPLCRSILTELSALNSENASIIADRVAAHTATEAAKAFDYKPIFTKLNKELRQGYKRAKNRYYYVDEVHEAAGQAWNEIKKACPESSGYESHISCFEALCGIAEIVNKEDVADGLQNGEFQNYLSEDMFK